MEMVCQKCEASEEMVADANNDPRSNFFMWPSHTDNKGLDILAFFCFSCGTISEAAPDIFGGFEYFDSYKKNPKDLEIWCSQLDISKPILSKLRSNGFLFPKNNKNQTTQKIKQKTKATGNDQEGIVDENETAQTEYSTFFQSIKYAYNNFFNISGRSTRSQYWWFTLFSILSAIIPLIFFYDDLDDLANTQYIYMFFIGIPGFTTTVRRCIDSGMNNVSSVILVSIHSIMVFAIDEFTVINPATDNIFFLLTTSIIIYRAFKKSA
jgi:uncharacterized membrane protein YhaH (DUF805 family)